MENTEQGNSHYILQVIFEFAKVEYIQLFTYRYCNDEVSRKCYHDEMKFLRNAC